MKKVVWDFIEEWLPNYSSSEEVALVNDLQKLVDEEFEPGDDIGNILQTEYGGDLSTAYPTIQSDINDLDYILLSRAVENFQEKRLLK